MLHKNMRQVCCVFAGYEGFVARTSAAARTGPILYCAQLEGEERQRKLHEDPTKRRGHVQMPRYNCKGWLYITVPNDRTLPIQVRMTHDEAHPHYTDISLLECVQVLIVEMKSCMPSDVSLCL